MDCSVRTQQFLLHLSQLHAPSKSPKVSRAVWASRLVKPNLSTSPRPILQNANPNTGGHLTLTESAVYSFLPLPNKRSSAAGTTTARRKRTRPWIVGIQSLESGKFIFKDDLFHNAPVHEGCKVWWPKVLNLSDYRVNEIARTYRLELVAQDGIKMVYPFSRVAVSSSFGKIDDGFAVMALLGCELYAWRKGDDEWTNVDGGEGFRYLSIAYHRGKFYAVSDDDKLTVTIDPVTLNVREVCSG
ncbi:hypothetical protein Tsubulata_033283 [Turnera subulata]|uniref:KIB1-4 beta-propeller domain-containing protein n=1 Tax=Turnera subulata TaxID=218843 RepID=A0A9Q0J1E0_9ROSI|nr:hypothetical protein Tsubulata_033283 [Turnera subulata]